MYLYSKVWDVRTYIDVNTDLQAYVCLVNFTKVVSTNYTPATTPPNKRFEAKTIEGKVKEMPLLRSVVNNVTNNYSQVSKA